MKITIRMIFLSKGIKVLTASSFPINERLFREDPHKEAAKVTKKWMKDFKHEYDIEEVIKVVYDGDKDITELVKE